MVRRLRPLRFDGYQAPDVPVAMGDAAVCGASGRVKKRCRPPPPGTPPQYLGSYNGRLCKPFAAFAGSPAVCWRGLSCLWRWLWPPRWSARNPWSWCVPGLAPSSCWCRPMTARKSCRPTRWIAPCACTWAPPHRPCRPACPNLTRWRMPCCPFRQRTLQRARLHRCRHAALRRSPDLLLN